MHFERLNAKDKEKEEGKLLLRIEKTCKETQLSICLNFFNFSIH
jgi:hypothetical protein